jgi:hypothetical protein
MVNCALSAPDEIHDLQRVTFADERVLVRLSLDDVQVVLNRDASWIYVELDQERRNRDGTVELEVFAVECDRHCHQARLEGVE